MLNTKDVEAECNPDDEGYMRVGKINDVCDIEE